MERFNYPSIAAVLAEDASLLYLLECEQYGVVRDREEEVTEAQEHAERQQRAMESGARI